MRWYQRSIDELLDEYQKTHTQSLNVQLHTICVPLIVWSLMLLIASFSLHLLNLVLCALFLLYGHWHFKLALCAWVFFGLMYVAMASIPEHYHLMIGAFVFVVAWIGQFVGHYYEGKKPAFLDDLIFLPVGPLWVIQKCLNAFNIQLDEKQ